MSIRLLATALLLLVAAGIVDARDLVVDNVAGSDSQNDRGQVYGPITNGPYLTINRALRAAMPGDRIVLTNTGEPYRECVSLVGWKHSGMPGKPFEIVGNGATLDGSAAPADQRWQHVGQDTWELVPSPPGYGLLTMGGKPLEHQTLPEGNLNNLQPLSWTRQGPRIYFRSQPNYGPFQYPLEVSDQTTGLTLYDVHHVVIRDLVVRGYRIDGININDRCAEISVLGVTTRQNGRSGITLAGASDAKIGATLSEQNGESQLRVEGRAVAYLGNVDFVAGKAEETVREGAGRVEKLPEE